VALFVSFLFPLHLSDSVLEFAAATGPVPFPASIPGCFLGFWFPVLQVWSPWPISSPLFGESTPLRDLFFCCSLAGQALNLLPKLVFFYRTPGIQLRLCDWDFPFPLGSRGQVSFSSGAPSLIFLAG
jgi:hypothetical protein